MSHYDPKYGIVLTQDDRDALRGSTDVAESIMDKIIWGSQKHFYKNSEHNNGTDKDGHQVPPEPA